MRRSERERGGKNELKMNDFEGKTALTTTSKQAELRYAQNHLIPWAARDTKRHIGTAQQLHCNRGHKRTNVKRKRKKTKWNQRMINAFLCSPWIIYHSQDDASVVMGMRQWYYMLTPTVDQTDKKKEEDFLWAFDGSLGFCCCRRCILAYITFGFLVSVAACPDSCHCHIHHRNERFSRQLAPNKVCTQNNSMCHFMTTFPIER